MKKEGLNLIAGCMVLAMIACNNSSDTASSNDSTNNANAGSAAATSTGNYTARADTVKANVTAGNYINPKTGKAYTNVTVDPNTGALTDESGTPIRRFVDRRTWWVYDVDRWDTIGSAKLQGNNLMYRDAKGNWVTYDKMWTDNTDTSTNMGNTDTGSKSSTNPKIKVSDKGKKVKVKDKQ